MAEYIDREKLIKRLHNAEENYKVDHDYDIDDDPFSDGILSAMFSVNQIVGAEPTADVIERSEYEKLRLVNLDLAETNKGLLAEHEQLEKLRSKIDKAIEEMNGYARFHRDKIHNDVERGKYLAYEKSLEILKRNIGE